ncbi:MAG: hypothetical protein M1281_04545 [Chloroflexi bacterium]|nr:hypothetical protein [Chloroflexota bacterium]
MARKPKRKTIKRFPTYDQLLPIDPDEFNTALNWVQNVATQKAQVTNPTDMGLNLDFGDGRVDHITFTDIPMNRMMIALKERYEDDPDKMYSISMRIFALFKIMHDPTVADKWMRKGEEEGVTEVHPGVTDAAATVRLNEEGYFPLDEFLARVKELADTKYKDEEQK